MTTDSKKQLEHQVKVLLAQLSDLETEHNNLLNKYYTLCDKVGDIAHERKEVLDNYRNLINFLIKPSTRIIEDDGF